jgi:hypothetical protein
MKLLIVRASVRTLALIVAAMLTVVGAPTAAAFPNAGPVVAFGTRVPLHAGNGVVIGYTVADFRPSTDRVEVFRVGHLWEATLTVEAIRGTATPILPFFNARAANGRQYRFLFQVYSPNAISPNPLPEGSTSTGKVYFDCNGVSPSIVIYNDGAQDLLTWR